MNLVFFSYNYPYVPDYSWKRNELAELAKHFSIKIIPFFPYTQISLLNVPDGIEVMKPLLDRKIDGKLQNVFTSFLSTNRFFYFKEFFREKVYLRKSWLLEWSATCEMTEILLKHPVIKSLLNEEKEKIQNTILYFYWGSGTTMIVPFLRKAGFRKIIVRFHGFDLYAERGIGYLPFRRDLLKNIDCAIPISEDGKKYLQRRYADLNFNVKVYRLGAKKMGESHVSQDGVLRIISCSHVIPIKRLEMISEAIKHLEIKVEWTHFGDGYLFEELRKNVQNLPSNVQVNLQGRVTTEEVLEYYSRRPVDLFLNVSASEGVPVSIMEAFSAGIPVYATDVGGTHEIVNNKNGKLLSKDITPSELANELKTYYNLKESNKLEFRKNARYTYDTKCDFNKLNEEFISFLKQ